MTNHRDGSPIAVIGFSFRMPGGRDEALWTALLAGRDLVTSVECDRWAQDTLTHPNKAEPGTSYTFAAGSIGDVAGFDAAFFSISPREAEQMDPQQRVLLEMSLEAFEHAGIPPSSMRGSRCGVYVGLSSVDYAYRRADDLGGIDATTMTGNAGSIAANRLSYVFDLRGPSMTIDTACSSSQLGAAFFPPRAGIAADNDALITQRQPATRAELLRALADYAEFDVGDYDSWREVGAIIHHETGGSDDGLELFIKYSRRLSGFYAGAEAGEEGCRTKWRSFGRSGAKPVAFGTLIYKLTTLRATRGLCTPQNPQKILCERVEPDGRNHR
jgi:Beta-ketoacyl synthase, N-terminal domain/Primase C terminal 2 (PriCT-2)